jgi:DNA repair helicase Rad3
LESPTGTGKTLCLLCATLAWRRDYERKANAQARSESGAASAAGTTAGTTHIDSFMTDKDRKRVIPKIVYASRTHSQLAQVVKELKNTAYKPKMCLLGSRQQLCVDRDVSQLQGTAQNQRCRAKVETRRCEYHRNVDKFRQENPKLNQEVLDVEDLNRIGRDHRVCPYYWSRSNASDADIVFLPYNYLIEPSIRATLDFELSNCIIVFDEAHNLEGVCGNSASFDLTPADVAGAIGEIETCLAKIKNPAYLMRDGDMQEDELAIMKKLLLGLEEAIAAIPLYDAKKGQTFPGSYIYEIFRSINVTHGSPARELQAALRSSTDMLFAGTDAKQSDIHRHCCLKKFDDAMRVLFSGATLSDDTQSSQFYRVHIHVQEDDKKKNNRRSNTSATLNGFSAVRATKSGSVNTQAGRTLSYWCFNPGVAMTRLALQKPRCIILTSGTLSPMDSFAHEFQLKFPIRIENPHVIRPEQVSVQVVPKGPNNITLSSKFENRKSGAYVNELAATILNFVRIIPDGVLVFFPSYAVLADCVKQWRRTGPSGMSMISRIGQFKRVFIEPRSNTEYNEVIDQFKRTVDGVPSSTSETAVPASGPAGNGNGGILFAVCRGKSSEGIDFSDRQGRGVIITGIPFPAYMDPKVTLKRDYLDKSPSIAGLAKLTGREWYSQQASRAVNQAMGRVIRHRFDYGVVLLCDERFQYANMRSQLSAWLRPHVKIHKTMQTSLASVGAFFRNIQRHSWAMPSRKPVPEAAPSSSNIIIHGTSSRDGSSSSSSSSAVDAATARGVKRSRRFVFTGDAPDNKLMSEQDDMSDSKRRSRSGRSSSSSADGRKKRTKQSQLKSSWHELLSGISAANGRTLVTASGGVGSSSSKKPTPNNSNLTRSSSSSGSLAQRLAASRRSTSQLRQTSAPVASAAPTVPVSAERSRSVPEPTSDRTEIKDSTKVNVNVKPKADNAHANVFLQKAKTSFSPQEWKEFKAIISQIKTIRKIPRSAEDEAHGEFAKLLPSICHYLSNDRASMRSDLRVLIPLRFRRTYCRHMSICEQTGVSVLRRIKEILSLSEYTAFKKAIFGIKAVVKNPTRNQHEADGFLSDVRKLLVTYTGHDAEHRYELAMTLENSLPLEFRAHYHRALFRSGTESVDTALDVVRPTRTNSRIQ